MQVRTPRRKKLRIVQGFLKGYPVWCTWQVTYNCNYGCDFCDYWQGKHSGETDLEGFRKGSPVNYAHQLKGNLLIIHGTGDDNCHYQTTELLINELIRHNKQFTMMAYPNRSHSIREGPGTTRHLRELMTRYLLENL